MTWQTFLICLWRFTKQKTISFWKQKSRKNKKKKRILWSKAQSFDCFPSKYTRKIMHTSRESEREREKGKVQRILPSSNIETISIPLCFSQRHSYTGMWTSIRRGIYIYIPLERIVQIIRSSFRKSNVHIFVVRHSLHTMDYMNGSWSLFFPSFIYIYIYVFFSEILIYHPFKLICSSS